jgi:hypothetical protein
MLIRGTDSYDHHYKLINMENIQMLRIITFDDRGKPMNGAARIVAYVYTGESNYGPMSVNVTQMPMNGTSYGIDQDCSGNVGWDCSSIAPECVIDTTNHAIWNLTTAVCDFARLYSNTADWVWYEWSNKSNPRNIVFEKFDKYDDNRYNHYISNGISLIELGYYGNVADAVIELNKIQREYSKYIRGVVSCFNPPKVYQLKAYKPSIEDFIFGSVGSSEGASFRFTTKSYVANNTVYADPGLYLRGSNYGSGASTATLWLKYGVDYVIDFPKYSRGAGSYTLTYRFKGSYIGLGTKTINVSVSA